MLAESRETVVVEQILLEAHAHHDQPEQPPLSAAALLDEYTDLGMLRLDEFETIVIAPLVRWDQKLLHAPLPVLGVQMRVSA